MSSNFAASIIALKSTFAYRPLKFNHVLQCQFAKLKGIYELLKSWNPEDGDVDLKIIRILFKDICGNQMHSTEILHHNSYSAVCIFYVPRGDKWKKAQSHTLKYMRYSAFSSNYQKWVLDQVAEGKAGLPSPWRILAIALGVNLACALLWRKT